MAWLIGLPDSVGELACTSVIVFSLSSVGTRSELALVMCITGGGRDAKVDFANCGDGNRDLCDAAVSLRLRVVSVEYGGAELADSGLGWADGRPCSMSPSLNIPRPRNA